MKVSNLSAQNMQGANNTRQKVRWMRERKTYFSAERYLKRQPFEIPMLAGNVSGNNLTRGGYYSEKSIIINCLYIMKI